MSSGWLRDPVVEAPVPFGWKLCFRVVPKATCLTVSCLGALVLGLALGELEVELELEHPAVPSRLAAATVAPRQVAVRRLKIFTQQLVCDQRDAWRSGVNRAGEQFMARRGQNSKILLNA